MGKAVGFGPGVEAGLLRVRAVVAVVVVALCAQLLVVGEADAVSDEQLSDISLQLTDAGVGACSGRSSFAPRPGSDFSLAAENADPIDVWSDGETMWVSDLRQKRIFAYDSATKARVEAEEFDLSAMQNPRGVWSDGARMFVSDSGLESVWIFDMETKRNTSAFSLLGGPAINDSGSVWSDGETMWIVDWRLRELRALEYGNWTDQDLTRRFSSGLLSPAGVVNPRGMWSDGETMWVSDATSDELVAFTLSTRQAAPDLDFSTLTDQRTRVEAEAFSEQVGMTVGAAADDGGGSSVSGGSSGDYLKFDVDLDGVDSVSLRFLNNGASGARARLRAGSLTGELLAEVTVPSTRGTQTWQSQTFPIRASDADSLYVVFHESVGFDLNWLELSRSNDRPYGMWSDGDVMWVVDQDDDRLYAYNMPVDNTSLRSLTVDGVAVDGFTPAGSTFTVTVDGLPASHVTVAAEAAHPCAGVAISPADADPLTDGHQIGLAAFADSGVSIAVAPPAGTGRTVAVDARFSRRSAEDFATLSAAGNDFPVGLWSDGTTMWVSDTDDAKIYAYDLATKARDADKDFALDAANTSPRGIWSDGTSMYVADSTDETLYVYDMATKARVTHDTLVGGNFGAGGVWGEGSQLWIVEWQNSIAGLWRYDLRSLGTPRFTETGQGGVRRAKTRQDLRDAGVDGPRGVWSDGVHLFVSGEAAAGDVDRVAAFSLSSGARVPDLDVYLHGGQPYGIWSDGDVMWVADRQHDEIRAYNMAASDNTDLRSLTVDGVSVDGFTASGSAFTALVDGRTSDVTVAAQTAHRYAAGVTISPADADPLTDGHQISVAGARTVDVEITVEAQDGTRRAVTVTVDARFSRRSAEDFATLSAAGNDFPVGLWSDGTTMWVSDTDDAKIYAYDLATKARDADKDFALDAANTSPRGIWSDGTSMYVADSTGDKLYVYDMATRALDGFHDLFAGNLGAGGVWAEGSSMWVAEWKNSGDGLYRYDLNNITDPTAVNPEMSRVALRDAGVDGPRGVWSDGVHLFVSGEAAAGDVDRVAAFSLSSGARVPDLDVYLHEGQPYGIWSDGDVMWVADRQHDEIRAYNMAASDNTDLRSLTVNGVSVDGFTASGSAFTASARGVVGTVTVAAQTAHRYAAGVTIISPADADPLTDGHQIGLRAFYDGGISIVVEAQDGTRRTVTVTGASSDTKLRSLTVDGVAVDGFAPSGSSFAASVDGASDTVTVAAETAHQHAVVAISPADADPLTDGHQISVAGVSSVPVEITVEAQDGTERAVTVEVSVLRRSHSDDHITDVALGARATGPSGAHKAVDGLDGTSVTLTGSTSSLEVDLVDRYDLVSVTARGTISDLIVEARPNSSTAWTRLARLDTSVASAAVSGAHRHVRIRPGGAASQTVSAFEVRAQTLKERDDMSVDLSAGLQQAGLSVRQGTWSVTGGKLVANAQGPASGLIDLCGGCDLDREAVRQATVKMLVEFPASNPSHPDVGTSLGIGFEESQGRRRGAEFQLGPWRPLSGVEGPLSFMLFCGGGGSNAGPSKLYGDGVNLDCGGGRTHDFVDHTAQDLDDAVDGDLSLAGSRVWVELEYRNLKLWARVWPENGQRPALPRAGIRFGTTHLHSGSFSRDPNWILNPGKLSLNAWGFNSGGPLKVSDITVTDLVVGPKLGTTRGSALGDDLLHRGRYYPMGSRVDPRPDFRTLDAADELPSIVVGSDSRYSEVFNYAWQSVFERMWVPGENGPANYYRSFFDESYNDYTFLWDMASMMWAGKYLNRAESFDPAGTLEVWYQSQRDDGGIARAHEGSGRVAIWAVKDGEVNPPLLVWSEWQWYLMTGDEDRVRRVVPALREYLDWVSIARWSQSAEHRLYWNDMGGSGMDILVRPYRRFTDGGQVYGDPDMSAQIAQAYLLMGGLYDAVGDGAEAADMRAKGIAISERVNHFLWKTFQEDGRTMGQWFYADAAGEIVPSGVNGYIDAPQALALWHAIVDTDDSHDEAVRNVIASSDYHNTEVPFPGATKSDPRYAGWGNYNYGILPPVAYQGVKAAEEVGGYGFAQDLATRYVDAIAEVYEYSGTIWEMYAPEKQTREYVNNHTLNYMDPFHREEREEVSSCGRNWCKVVKRDYDLPASTDRYAAPASRPNDRNMSVKPIFAGWAALPPIALTIEHILGIRPNVPERTVTWHLTRTDRHGIENLWLGEMGRVSLIAAQRDNASDPVSITVSTADHTVAYGSFRLLVVLPGGCTHTVRVSQDTASATHSVTPCSGLYGKVGFESGHYRVAEGGAVELAVTLSSPAGTAVTLGLDVDVLEEASESDFDGARLPSSVTFEPGETRKTFRLFAVDDGYDDDGEMVRLYLVVPKGMTAGARQALVSIVDDDDSSGAGVVLARSPADEFDLEGSGNHGPWDLWSDGTTMWVSDDDRTAGRIYAWDMASKQRQPSNDIELAAGNVNPRGIWSDGSTMWVADKSGKLFAYGLTTKSHLRQRSFSLQDPDGNFEPGMLWMSDANTAWVTDFWNPMEALRAFDLAGADEQRIAPLDSSRSVAGGALAAAQASNLGVWSDGEYLIMPSSQSPRMLVALRASDGALAETFWLDDFLGEAWGLWSDGETLWVADSADGQIHAYKWPAPSSALGSLTVDGEPVDGFDTSEVVHDVVLDASVTRFTLAAAPESIFATVTDISPADADPLTDGHQVDVAGAGSTVVSVTVEARDESRTVHRVEVLGRDSSLATLSAGADGDSLLDLGASSTRSDYVLAVGGEAATVTVLATPAGSRASVRYSIRDADIDASGHQMRVHPGATTLLVTVTAENGVAQSVYRLTVLRDSSGNAFARLPSADFDLAAAGNDDPVGIWSDGSTMWVSDHTDAKIYAYDAATGARKPAEDFDDLTAAGNDNDNPQGIWSDGSTMWVVEASGGTYGVGNSGMRVYAYSMGTKRRVGSEIRSSRGFDLESPSGIWSDGSTIWVLGISDRKAYAFDKADRRRTPGLDLDVAAAVPSAARPRGLWSDGVTWWVSNGDPDRLFAVSSSGTAEPGLNFNTLDTANDNPYGIWSHGGTMWVADPTDGKLYAYRMPLSASTLLGSLTIDGQPIAGFDPAASVYTRAFPGGVEEFTVAATAAHHRAAVVSITPADADPGTDGHQVSVTGGSYGPVRITVQAANGATRAVTLTAPRPSAALVAPPSVALTEGASVAVAAVLGSQPSAGVTVTVTSSDAAVTVSPAQLTFTSQNWNTPQTVEVSASRDADTADAAATVTLSAAGGGYDGVSAATEVQVADDRQVAASFAAASLTVDEGSDVTVEVTLSGGPRSSVSIPITAVERSEAVPAQVVYWGLPEALVFAAGETSQSFTVTPLRDGRDVDAGWSLALGFGDLPTGVSAGAVSAAIVTVADLDDPVAPVAHDDIAFVAAGETVAVGVLDNDHVASYELPDSIDPSTLIIVEAPQSGTATVAGTAELGRHISYTAGSGDGSDTLRYRVCHTAGQCAEAEVSVMVGTTGCTIVGTDGDDTLTGTGADEVICALGGDDTIDGGGGNDIIYAGPGDDTVSARSGDVVIVGGPGDDFIRAANPWSGTGNSAKIWGGPGNDEIRGTGGHDEISGGPGVDTIFAGEGHDLVWGGPGTDTLNGGPDIDLLFGGSGDDRIDGSLSDDRLFGGPGDDTLTGGDEENWDTLRGGSGNDTLWGDYVGNDAAMAQYDAYYWGWSLIDGGGDLLYGGPGADTLHGTDRRDWLFGGSGDDTIDGGAGSLDYAKGGPGTDTCTNSESVLYCEPVTVSAEPPPGPIGPRGSSPRTPATAAAPLATLQPPTPAPTPRRHRANV